MGILVDVILIAAIGGYAGYLIWHILSSMKAGKGNPYGCSGDCGKCGGGCSCSCSRQVSVKHEVRHADRWVKEERVSGRG